MCFSKYATSDVPVACAGMPSIIKIRVWNAALISFVTMDLVDLFNRKGSCAAEVGVYSRYLADSARIKCLTGIRRGEIPC